MMSFWVYMLHCRGGYLYVGHTDNLERRVGQHDLGVIPGFTADHRPVKLIWSDHVATRDEARAFEARLKGWNRAKKLALVRGDWDEVSRLAKGKAKEEGQGCDTLRQSGQETAPPPEPIG